MPCCAACCSAPRATSVKNGLRTSSRMKPIELLLPALSCRAASLRTKPSWSIAARTRSRVAGATFSGRFKHVGDRAEGDTGALGDVADADLGHERNHGMTRG